MYKPFYSLLFTTLLISGHLNAESIKIIGTTSLTVKTPAGMLRGEENSRQISLLKVQIDPNARQLLAQHAKKSLLSDPTDSSGSNTRLPQQIQLGMNGVPVLDQGNHGTCVTFAVTGALDAAIGEGDYLSQLCPLQLGLHLESNGYNPSGWDGTWGRHALSQFSAFGIVSKDQQREHGCGDLVEYPVTGAGNGQAMTLESYHELSESLEEKNIEWTQILDANEALSSRVDTNQTLNEIKRTLSAGNRLTFGTLLLDFDLGFVGAVGSNKANYDSWVLTPEIARDIYISGDFGAHEMIITGYDDNAIAIDDHNQQHKGLLTLRNSWSDAVGDHGNFYMSYDYFKVLVIEAYRIKATG